MASDKETPSQKIGVSGRLLFLAVTGFLALALIFPLAGSDAAWDWHTDAVLFIAMMLGVTAGSLLLFRYAAAPSLPRFYASLAFYVFAVGSVLLWVGGIFLEGISATSAAALQSWSSTVVRSLLALFLLIAAKGELKHVERETEENRVGMIMGMSAFLILLLLLATALFPFPERVSYGVIGKMQEGIPFLLFLAGFVVILREGSWVHDRFAYGMAWTVLLQLMASLYFSFSSGLGSSFDVAAYIVQIFGLTVPILTLQSEMFRLYRASEQYRFEQERLMTRLGVRNVRKELVAEVFRQAVEQSQDPLYITDHAGHIVFVNDGFSLLSGYAAGDMLGEMPDTWTAPAAGGEAYSRVLAQVRLRKEPWNFVVQNKRKDGSLYEAGVAVSPILNELGEVAWFILREHDLSETKNRSLILQQILDNMPVGIGLIEMPSTRVLLSNNYARSLFRRMGIEQIREFQDIVPFLRLPNGKPYPEEKLPHTEVMRTHEVAEADDIQVWKTGATQRDMIWKVHATPIFNAKAELTQLLLAFDDVTQAKELEHKMTDAVSVAAHQLRTPLTGIKWAIDEYRKSEEHGVSTEDRAALFDTLYEATVRMFNVIQGLLDVSKLEQGKVEIKPEPVHLDAFIEKALQDFAHPVAEKKLLVKQAALHTIPELNLDVILLRQVIQNLIDNAVKYTPVGGEIASILSVERDRVHWTLHDTGIGIMKSDLEHLFEKFHRGDNAQRLDAYGMGLGLYAVKSIMDLLGGEIRCESEEGHGTTFHLLFPLKRA